MIDPFPGQSMAEVFGHRQGAVGGLSKVYDRLLADGMDPQTPVELCGWRDSPDRHALARTFAPPFAQAAPGLMGDSADCLLYKAYKTALGNYPAYVRQEIGDCFPAGTMVRMAGRTERPIEAVRKGDRVMTHEGRPMPVLRTLRKHYSGEILTLGARGCGRTVSATIDHRFRYFPGTAGAVPGWKPIAGIEPGMTVIHEEDVVPWPVAVERIDRRDSHAGEVFCLEVEDDHSFVANGFHVHNCTSFGSGHAVDLLQCVEITIGKEPIAFLETCTEAIYGMGREIGNMLGGGDGCYGVAVAKALTTMGAVPRKLVGDYSGQRAKQWGSRGVPAEIKTAAAAFKVGAAAMVTTLEELDAALANCYPAAGGFSQGFTMHRDSDGMCRQSGRWGHEQCCAGRRTKNGKPQYLLLQSWGPGIPDGPTTDDQPDFSFWIDAQAMASILSQNDFLAFSKFPGFDRRPIPAEFDYASAVA
jgi:hypothetical protein